jgi:periplasmic divalent cation tolerance protein
VCEVAVTGPDPDGLAALVRTLVDERLVACGQITGATRSIYRWQGEVCDDPEVRAVLHTRAELVPEVGTRIRELHPYDVPCVVAVAAAGGDRDYLAWVRQETRTPGTD